jgi:DNA/RNA endonuclease G (NUC1)
MYCIILRNKFDKTIVGWYDASASNFSTDQRRAKLFVDRVDADLVADQLRRMDPRFAQDIEVTPAVQPTSLTYSSNGRNRVAIV